MKCRHCGYGIDLEFGRYFHIDTYKVRCTGLDSKAEPL